MIAIIPMNSRGSSNEQDTLEEESEAFLKLIILEVMGGMKGQFPEFSLEPQLCTEIYC